MELNSFIKKIPDFGSLSSSAQIDFFVYYLIHKKELLYINQKDIQECFNLLNLVPYSNISSYLSKWAKRNKNQKFIKKKNGYVLENNTKLQIDAVIKAEIQHTPSDGLFPVSIFDNTRGYLVAFATEAASCYDYNLYNSCFFMLRKLFETLIIELFERNGLEAKIKNGSGGYLFLSDLIRIMMSEKTWHFTKIVREEIPKIKKLADSSVHSKRFSAKKSDIDNIKTDLRIIFQEFIGLIDYPTWK